MKTKKTVGFKVDPITEIVAHQTISVLKIANYSAKTEQH